jgi:hypothetical protein
MMTEAEAKKKWCPAAQELDRMANCLASGCMAWRWYVTAVDDKDNDIHDHGYCGLAGKP